MHIIYIIAGTGAGLAGVAAALMLFEPLSKLKTKFKKKAEFKRRSALSGLTLVEKLKTVKKKDDSGELRKLALVSLGFGAFLAFSMPGFVAKIYGFLLGSVLAALVYVKYDNFRRGGDNAEKLKEAVLLYDAVEVFASRGLGVQQALKKSLPLLKSLRPAVEKCLKKFPYAPAESIAGMEKDMGFEEAGVLVSLLLQLLAGGSGSTIASSEAVRLEKIRRALVRKKLSMRPTYQQFQLYVPFGCGVAIVLYVLVRHVQTQFASLTGAGMVNQLIK